MERIYRPHTHSMQAVTLPWQSHPASIFTGMLVVITFSSNKHIRLNDTHMRGLEAKTAVGRKREASSTINCIICRTSVNCRNIANVIQNNLQPKQVFLVLKKIV